jgi:hypothetical protein
VCHLKLAGQFQLVAIALGLELGEQPFARVDAKARALDVLGVEHRDLAAILVLTLHPVVGAVIRDLVDLVGHALKLDIPRARIMRRKPLDIIDVPAAHGALVWHVLVAANLPQRFAGCDAFADFSCERFREFAWAASHAAFAVKITSTGPPELTSHSIAISTARHASAPAFIAPTA